MFSSARMIFCLTMTVGLSGATAQIGADQIQIDCYRLRAPGDAYDIQQGSDLHFEALGERRGLWIACDRNGREAAGKIYFISAERLKEAKPGGTIVADDEFTIVAPAGEWSAFAEANKGAGEAVLADVRRRITPGPDRSDEPYLDLECITFAPGIAPPAGEHVFVVAEEPYSAVLELAMEGKDGRARLLAVYEYAEKPEDQGSGRNDGLEGLAWAGKPGEFYFAEEATRPVDGQPRSLMLFSVDPRLGRAKLKDGRVDIETDISDALTAAIRKCRKGKMQTLNAVTVLKDGRLLAVDRNGGWIDLVDPDRRTAEAWLNLYDLNGRSLRTILADFPEHRKMPYVSIEGIALDDAGAMWLVDDPAAPEGWRESCLVRLMNVPPLPAKASAPAH